MPMMSGMSDPQGTAPISSELQRLGLALRASNEGIWDWVIAQPRVYYSRRILDFLNCGENNAPHLFQPPWSYIHEDDREGFAARINEVLRPYGRDLLSTDVRVRKGDGSWVWLRIRGTVVRDREGIATRIAGSMIDISQRKMAEAQIEEERFQLRQLIDRVPLQIYFKDIQSRFVTVNQRTAAWMGLTDSQQLIGKHDRDFFAETHWRAAEQDEQRIMETGNPVTNQLETETWRTGDETWVLTSKFPWCDSAGRVKGTFGVSSDVTDLVIARKEAATMADELKHKNDAYEEELHLAREIQHALTNREFPTIRSASVSIEFLARYVPISGLAGDFFEIIEFSPQKVGLLICDVMGHGVRAALVVAMLRGLLEKQRSQAADPGQFLQNLNDGLFALLARAQATMFATAFYGVIDLTENTLTHACAGHPSPIAETAEGIIPITPAAGKKGPALGLIAQAKFPVATLPLAGLKRLLLFTDGVLEAENQSGEPFLENRLMETIASATSEPLDALLDTILERILTFSGSGHFDDDVCLLGVALHR